VVGPVGDDADVDALLRIGAGEGVDDVDEVGVVEVGDKLGAQRVEIGLADRLVDLPPADPLLALAVADDELVLRRAPRVLAGVGLR
jgi:hypothetical protein